MDNALFDLDDTSQHRKPPGSRRRTRWARTRAMVAALVVAPLVLGGCVSGERSSGPSGEGSAGESGSAPAGDTGRAEQLASEATGSGAFVHLQALQAIADRNGGNRALGTSGYDQSVDYVAATLRRAGYEVETPTITVQGGGASDDDNESEGATTTRTTRNVIAQTKNGRADEVVLTGAHLDSVPEGPGIDDDGSGVAAQLEIALKLGSDVPLTNAVRFVWFGAEEEGLLGSQAYVRNMSPAQRRDIALMLNSDVIAAPNAGYFVYDGDNSDGKSTEPVPRGSQAIERLLTGRLATLGVQARGTPFISDSDYGPFVAAGIPSGGVFSGDAGTKSPEQAGWWGGRAGAPFDSCYHQGCDNIDNVSRPVFDRMVNTLAFGIGVFAVDLNGVPPRAERTAR